ncbi:hypothetical protein RLK93_07845, partial [Streptococcus pneumoniae]|nr:hypothetical protein [Streptococcus pneumoniae]
DGLYYYDLVEVDGELVYPVSPNNDGLNDKINGNITLLRNADELQTNILNAEGEKVRTVNIEKDVRKNYFNGGSGTFLSYSEARAW